MWFKKQRKQLEKDNNVEDYSTKFSDVEDLEKINLDDLTEEEKALLEKEKERRKQEKVGLDEAEQKVSKGSQKKKKIRNIIFFILNLGIVAGLLAYQLTKEAFVPLTGLNLDGLFLFLLVVCFVGIELFDTSCFSYLIKKDTGNYHFAIALKTMGLGKYYDCITPLAVGGQPFQVAYLKNHDVSASASLSIPVAKMVFQQIVFFVVSIVALIVSSIDSSFGSFVSISSIIGFIVSFAWLFFLIFLSVSKNIGKKLVVKVLKLLQKMKIIKDYEKQYQRVTKYVADYQTIITQYMKSPKDFIFMFTVSLFRAIVSYTMPFIIYSCFFTGGTFDLFFKFFVCGVLIDLASSFFPMPGGTGMNELTFGALFGTFFSGGRLFWAIIFWRLVTYYLHILIGIVIMSYDVSYGNRKYRWRKKIHELQEDSLEFKQIQIQNFREERSKRRKKTIKNAQ